jgi:hypothetical protein
MNKSLNEIISESRRLLQNPYAYLNGEGCYEAVIVPRFREIKSDPIVFSPDLIRGCSLRSRKGRHELRYSFVDIEQNAKNLQNTLWKHRRNIWSNDVPSNPLDILDPALAIKSIGYDYDLSESLGQFSLSGKLMEVAGVIDSSTKEVKISRQFQPTIRNFTTAHELGHAILHDAKGLHRDRPLDGTMIGESREALELEADKFATYFLMPSKLIRSRFNQFFCTSQFLLTEETLFALTAGKSTDLRNKIKSLRDLSRLLANAEFYNGKYFDSLANQFKVSSEAMAIRLEEMKLISV